MLKRILLVVVPLVGAGIVGGALVARMQTGSDGAPDRQAAAPGPQFVGAAECARCHENASTAWQGSHHDLAMDTADSETNRAPFQGESFTYYEETARFFREDGDPHVSTLDGEGERQTYPIAYTFGVEPLQQYLVETERGRLQALPFAWDTRPEDDGGQRWFHLYPDEYIEPGDELHWTGPNQNWNHMCADCHSTNLRKNYDNANDRFRTSWSEMDVSCESCHGPGSEHVAWAESPGDYEGETVSESLGLTVRLKDTSGGTWQVDEETGVPSRTAPRSSRAQVETCARCHARRSPLAEDFPHGQPVMDNYLVSNLEPELYFADGQIRDEVYVYGSFRQSKMYHEGVSCSDCHEPHSAQLKLPGNALCTQCHGPSQYDTPEHHHHEPATEGASCVDCHMPERTYMVVDPRRDHSFRVPRPALSDRIGAPDACTQCHEEKQPGWAAERIAEWTGGEGSEPHPFAEAFARADMGHPNAAPSLESVAESAENDAIERASAVSRLSNLGRQVPASLLDELLDAEDPLLRHSAVASLQDAGERQRLEAAAPLLDDPVGAVRLEAARVMASVPESYQTEATKEAFRESAEEYIDVQQTHGDRAASQHNLGAFYAALGQPENAISAYRTAFKRDPNFVPAYVNLADFHRERNDDNKAHDVLDDGLEANPDAPVLLYSHGLALARIGEPERAARELERAAEGAPGNPQYGYAHGVALHSNGRAADAIAALEANVERHPFHQESILALATMERDRGNYEAALRHTARLIQIWPQEQRFQQLRRQLQNMARSAQ